MRFVTSRRDPRATTARLARDGRRALVAAVTIFTLAESHAQSLRIGIVDFYGLRRISEARAREELTVKEGDSIDTAAMAGGVRLPSFAESERRLAALPGVLHARLHLVCCDAGNGILYVGIEEQGAPAPHFRKPPRGQVRLAPEVMETGNEFSRAVMAAVERGDAAEDRSKGHSLMHDPAARAIQERFIEYARDLPRLRDVLRHASDPEHRALAAEILGYAANKRDVVDDLVYGMNDPSESVRNNATRALAVIGNATTLRVPIDPFIALIQSPVWTDRNKASLALLALSESRDRDLLVRLRSRAIAPLVEMARWKSEGHATPAFLVLGRIEGWSDEDLEAAWKRGDREIVIASAVGRR